MPFLDANVSRYSFECANLAPDSFQVVSFQGVEGLSRLYRFDLHLVSTDPMVSFEKVVGKPATFTMMRGLDPVPVSGLVVHLEQAGRTKDFFAYRAVLMPRLWKLSLVHRSRVFRNMRTDEIVSQVLDEAEIDFEMSAGGMPPLEFRVQYQETDLQFVSRLLEHDGITYFFEQDGQMERLVLTGESDRFPPLPYESVLPYGEDAGMEHEREIVREVSYREQVITGGTLVADYNYQTPDYGIQGQAGENDGFGLYYEYGPNAPHDGFAGQYAEIRREEIEAGRRILRGESNCAALHAGYRFTLAEYYRETLNQDYVLTSVEHSGNQGAAMGLAGIDGYDADGEAPHYGNVFTAIPASVRFRPPRRTPKPNVGGVVTARIESAGSGGKYAYVDEEGRYHARLHFDLDNPNGKGDATHPIRMIQPYSGPGYGIHFPNHEDTELILAFENGDVDRPIALGTVPNPLNTSPVVADNRMQNVIRTAAGSEIILDDTDREAQILIKSPDAHRILLDDKDDRIVVESTSKHVVTLDDRNEKVEVKTKEGHFVLLDDANQKMTLQSKAGHRISINDKEQLITMVDEAGKNLIQIDIGNNQLTLKSEEGGIELLAPNGLVQIKAKELKTETTGDTSLKGANITSKADSDYKIDGANVTISATNELKLKGMNVTSEASTAHTTKGMVVKSEGSATNDVRGQLVFVKASSVNTIEGALVKIN